MTKPRLRPPSLLFGSTLAPKHGARWTPEDDARLRAAWPSGGCDGGAVATGRTSAAASQRGLALGLGAPERGLAVERIARLARCSRRTALRAISAAGIPTHPRPRRHADDRSGGRTLVVAPALAGRAVELARASARGPKTSPKGRWGILGRPAACAWHGKADRPHYARGLCAACRTKAYRLGVTP